MKAWIPIQTVNPQPTLRMHVGCGELPLHNDSHNNVRGPQVAPSSALGVTSEIQFVCFLVSLLSFVDSGKEHAPASFRLLAEFSSLWLLNKVTVSFLAAGRELLQPLETEHSPFHVAPFICKVSNRELSHAEFPMCFRSLSLSFSATIQRIHYF